MYCRSKRPTSTQMWVRSRAAFSAGGNGIGMRASSEAARALLRGQLTVYAHVLVCLCPRARPGRRVGTPSVLVPASHDATVMTTFPRALPASTERIASGTSANG